MATLKLLKQAISLIDCEIGLVEAELQYPDRFIVFPADHAPLARWGGNVVDLIEYFIGPQAAGIIQHPSGKPMNFEETVELIKRIFGITIPHPHERRGKVLDRQKNTTFKMKCVEFFRGSKKKSQVNQQVVRKNSIGIRIPMLFCILGISNFAFVIPKA